MACPLPETARTASYDPDETVPTKRARRTALNAAVAQSAPVCVAPSDDRDRDRAATGGAHLLRLPVEVLDAVVGFLGPTDLLHGAAACVALYAVAAPRLRREGDARDEFLRRCRGMCADPAGRHGGCADVQGLARMAADTCRRWGLSPEGSFSAIRTRMHRLLIVPVGHMSFEAHCVYHVHHLHAERLLLRRDENAAFAERHAHACATARNPVLVLRAGDVVGLSLQTDATWVGRLAQVDLRRVTPEQCVALTMKDNRLVLCLRIDRFAHETPSGTVSFSLNLWTEVPADAAPLAHGGGDGSRLADACARYATHLEQTWDAPPGSVAMVRTGHEGSRNAHRWRLAAAAQEAAFRYYARVGLPVSRVTAMYSRLGAEPDYTEAQE